MKCEILKETNNLSNLGILYPGISDATIVVIKTLKSIGLRPTIV